MYNHTDNNAFTRRVCCCSRRWTLCLLYEKVQAGEVNGEAPSEGSNEWYPHPFQDGHPGQEHYKHRIGRVGRPLRTLGGIDRK